MINLLCSLTNGKKKIRPFVHNRVKADHGKLERFINPAQGFQSMKTTYTTIKGFEVIDMFKKGQFKL